MLLPEPDQTILCRRDKIISALKRFVPAGAVIDDDAVISTINDEITAQAEIGVFETAQTQAEVAEEEDAE